jgi:hypothetical protein
MIIDRYLDDRFLGESTNGQMPCDPYRPARVQLLFYAFRVTFYEDDIEKSETDK